MKKNKVTYEENQEKKHINKRPPPSRKPPPPIFSHLFRKRNGKHLLRTRARRKNSEENGWLGCWTVHPCLTCSTPSQNPIPGARCFLTAVYLIQGGPAVKLSRFQPAFRALHRGGAACPAPLWFCLPAHGCPALLARASYPSNRKLVGGIW